MRRYIKQPDEFSCGPIAIFNALKWAGLDADLSDLQFGCRTVDPTNNLELNGTTDHDFDRVLRWAGKPAFKVKRKKNPSFNKIKKHVEDGGSVCMVHVWGNADFGHFVFIERIERGLFFVMNDYDCPKKESFRKRKEQTLRKWLRDRREGHPIVWFLTKLEPLST